MKNQETAMLKFWKIPLQRCKALNAILNSRKSRVSLHQRSMKLTMMNQRKTFLFTQIQRSYPMNQWLASWSKFNK